MDRALDAWPRLPGLKLNHNTRRYGVRILDTYNFLQGKSAEFGFAEVPSRSWRIWCLNSLEAGFNSASLPGLNSASSYTSACHQSTGEFKLHETMTFPHTRSLSNWAAPCWSGGEGRAPFSSALHHKRWRPVSSMRKTPEGAAWRPLEEKKKSSDAGLPLPQLYNDFITIFSI